MRRGHASTSDLSPRGARADGGCRRSPSRATRPRTTAPGCPSRSCSRRTRRTSTSSIRGRCRTEEAIELAQRCEAAAFAVATVIRNSEGATVSTQHSQFVLANSLGFMGGYPGSRHYLSCAVIAEQKGLMQRDDWYSSSRVPAKHRRAARARPLCRAARRRAPGRAQDRHLPGAGALRGAGGDRLHRPLRLGGERRQPLSQDHASSSTASASKCSRRSCRSRSGPFERAGRGEHAVRRRRRGDARAHARARRRAGGLFPRQLLARASSACRAPATPAATTT